MVVGRAATVPGAIAATAEAAAAVVTAPVASPAASDPSMWARRPLQGPAARLVMRRQACCLGGGVPVGLPRLPRPEVPSRLRGLAAASAALGCCSWHLAGRRQVPSLLRSARHGGGSLRRRQLATAASQKVAILGPEIATLQATGTRRISSSPRRAAACAIPEPQLPRHSSTLRQPLKVVQWNLGGLRAFLRKRPGALPSLVEREEPDVLCILEHRLQEDHTESERALDALLEALPDYKVGALHYSAVKKGYSGVAMLLRKASGLQPLDIRPEDPPCVQGEGRVLLAEYEELFLVLCYVPNAGQGLKRLEERTTKWDVQFRDMLQLLSSIKPTVAAGDFNVAHLDEDIWNVDAPHVARQAGTTPEERESFSVLLDTGFRDGFRYVHPEATGAFTYWSVRARNRPQNRGLRLDYFVVSEDVAPDSHGQRSGAEETRGVLLDDVFHLADLSTGDHCPVGALLSVE